jgi:hypothetical protein
VLKKVITYTNPFTDEEITEEHYFHISKADIVEMQMEEIKASYVKDGETLTGMQAKLQQIVDSEDGKAIMREFKDIIRRAYGKKEGVRFLKSNEIWEEFASSEAYSQLIFDICTDAAAASEFINGIIPKNMDQIAEEIQAKTASSPLKIVSDEAVIEEAPEDPTGLTQTTTPRVLTTAEITEMDSDELKSGLATGRYKLS